MHFGVRIMFAMLLEADICSIGTRAFGESQNYSLGISVTAHSADSTLIFTSFNSNCTISAGNLSSYFAELPRTLKTVGDQWTQFIKLLKYGNCS